MFQDTLRTVEIRMAAHQMSRNALSEQQFSAVS